MTDNLDRKAMIAKRVTNCKMAIERYRPLLQNIWVPIRAKMMCVRTIIQPTLTYGGEIWGLSKARVAPAESALCSAVRTCLRLPRTVSRYVAYAEFRLRSIYEVSAIARARIFFKCQILNSWLKKVLSGTTPRHRDNRGVKLWSEVANQWLGKAKLEQRMLETEYDIDQKIARLAAYGRASLKSISAFMDLKRKIVPNVIREVMRERCRPSPNAKSTLEMRYASPHGASRTASLLVKLTAEMPDLAYGWTVLYRIRMGRYWTAPRLARAGLISRDFLGSCPFCKAERPETEAHYLRYCKRWEDIRTQTLYTMPPIRKHALDSRNDAWKLVIAVTGLDPLDLAGFPPFDIERFITDNLAGLPDGKISEIVGCVAQFLAKTSARRFSELDFVR